MAKAFAIAKVDFLNHQVPTLKGMPREAVCVATINDSDAGGVGLGT